MISTAHSVAEDGNLSLRDRLLGVFEALHGSAFQSASPAHAFELLQSAQSADGALLVQLDRDLMGIVAALLAEGGAAHRWKKAHTGVHAGAVHVGAPLFQRDSSSSPPLRCG